MIVHGLYNAVPLQEEKFSDEHVHVVYAGTFDPTKGGAYAAISIVKYLPASYHIHICGFGNSKQTKEVVSRIKNSQVSNQARITYEGMLNGKDFTDFIQKCEIGLSCQNPEGAFNDTSFPSKILNYLSNGLKVVTIDIPAVRQSKVGDFLFYYKKQDPEAIAKAIVQAHEMKGVDGRKLLYDLDLQFEKELQSFLR